MPAPKEAAVSDPQTAPAVLMIRPVAFHSNPETKASNAFQRAVGAADPAEVQARAGAESDGLALQGRDGTVLALSEAAHDCLRPDQRAALARHATLVVAPVPTNEAHAGGSVRCMLAEIFLPLA